MPVTSLLESVPPHIEPPAKLASMVVLSNKEVRRIVMTDATARRILEKRLSPACGDLIGARLNLNVLQHTGVAIQTLHRATSLEGHKNGRGWWRGEALDYRQVVVLEDAWFNVDQCGREAIAQGGSSKFPMASVDGVYAGEEAVPDFTGLPVRFNPKLMHLFCGPDDRAVRWAERVTVFGHRVFAHGEVEYHSDATAPPRAGTAPSIARIESP